MPIADKNVVGDLFWTNMAAEQVYNSFEKRVKAVTDLQNLIKWVFSIFTAGGLIVAFFAKPENYDNVTLIVLGVGFATLVVAYYITTTAAFPVPMELCPNEPEVIRAAFTEAILKNTNRFQTASLVTFAGFLCIAVGILIQFGQPGDKKEKESDLSFNAKVTTRDNVTYVPITVRYKPKITIDISVTANEKHLTGADTVYRDTKFYTGVFQTDDSLGLVYTSCLFPQPKIKAFKVKVTSSEKLSDGNLKETTVTKLVSEADE